MAKSNKAHPHHAKPYGQKVAQRSAAKRAMRTGGESNVPGNMHPEMPRGAPNPPEESRVSDGPDAQRNPMSEKEKSKKSPDRPREPVLDQAKARMNNGPAPDEI